MLAGGTVAADGHEFEVDIDPDSVPDEINEGENLTVDIEVANVGDEGGSQTIRLEDGDGNEQNSTTTSRLSAGNSDTVRLTWEEVPQERSITAVARSDDDTDSAGVTVLWSEFEVRAFTVDTDEVAGGTPVTFEATIRNVGTERDTQNIILSNNTGQDTASESVELGDTDETTVHFENIVTPSDPGEYTYDISTDNESEDLSINILEPAEFSVSIAETTAEGTGFELVATIENEGELEQTQPVEFSVDGTEVESRDVQIAGGEEETVTFSYDTGENSFAVDASVKTQQPDIATTRITQAAIEDGPRIDGVTPDSIQGNEEIEVTYTASGPNVDTATLIITDPNGDTFESRDVDLGVDQVEQILLPDGTELTDGTYSMILRVEDDFERTDQTTRSNAFRVSTVADADEVDFSEDEYRSVAGDFVEVDISIGDQDEAYILMGGDRDVNNQNFENYLDVLHVDGDATFIINTRLVGTDRPSEDVFIPVDGDVTSYAHDLGADSEPEGDFDGVTFERDGGGEIASTLAEFREEMGVSSRGSPLQASRYRMVAGGDSRIIRGDDGIPDVQHPVARSNLVLTQPEIGGITTYTLPPGPADRVDQFDDDDQAEIGDIGGFLGEATETDLVASGDRILIEVQTSGMFGALLDQNAADSPAVDDGADGTGEIPAEWMQTLLDTHEGVSIELADSELAGPNRPGADLRFSNVDSSDMYILPDDTADQWDDGDALGDEPVIGGFYIVIDTRGSDPFDGRPTDGDELTFEIAYESPDGERYQYQDYSLAAGEKPDPFNPAVSTVDGLEHFPYFGSRGTTVSANSSFVFEEPYIDYGETTLDDELLVAAEDGGVISGETNIAPGSQAEIQLVASNRPEPELISIEDVEITEDRTFEVTEDFSPFEPGERVEVEFYTQGRLTEDRIIDKRGVRVVEDLDNPATFEITEHTESAEVMRGTRLSDIEATITNTGDIADRQQVRFEIDGEGVKQETVTLDSGESQTLDLSESFVVLSPGEYTYTITTDDDEQTGELTVTEADAETAEQLENIDMDDPAVEDNPEEAPDEDDDDGGVGLFGIQRRDIAVAATVTGAMHVLGQWT